MSKKNKLNYRVFHFFSVLNFNVEKLNENIQIFF